MKKTLLAIVFAAFINLSAYAQLGVKAGINFAKISESDIPGMSEKSLNNIYGGFFFDKDLIPLLKIRIGIDYAPKGSYYEDDNIYTRTQLNYLELPVLAKVKLGHLYALGGIYGAYAINGTTELNTGLGKISSDVNFNNIKRIDAGMKFGVGYQLKLGPVGAFIQGEYSFGIIDTDKSSSSDSEKINKVFSFSIGILLGK